MLNFPVSILETALAQSDLKIVNDEEILVYRPWKYKEEQEVPKILSRLTDQPRQKITKKEELLLAKYSEAANEEQLDAVKQGVESPFMVLTGGPGTGKTYTLNLIIQFLKRRGLKIALAAPTGRAAKRMEESTGMEAQTLHRLL